MSLTLQLTRRSRLADAARAYEVLLDGEVVGEVRNHASTELSLAPGRHEVQARNSRLLKRRLGLSSPIVSFEARDGDRIVFEVHPRRYPQAALSWVRCLLVGPKDNWLQIEKVGRRPR